MPAMQPCHCATKEKEQKLLADFAAAKASAGENSAKYAALAEELGELYLKRRDNAHTKEYLEKARLAASHAGAAETEAKALINLSQVSITSMEPKRALDYAKDAVDVLKAKKNTGMPMADALSQLGWAQAENKNFDASLSSYEQAMKIREKLNALSDEKAVFELQQVSAMYERVGRYKDADAMMERALASMIKLHGPKHPLVEWLRELLAGYYADQKDYAKSEELYKTVIADRKSVIGETSPQVLSVLFQYAEMLTRAGRTSEADKIRAQANDIAMKMQKARP